MARKGAEEEAFDSEVDRGRQLGTCQYIFWLFLIKAQSEGPTIIFFFFK